MSQKPMPNSAHGEEPMPSSFDDDLEFWEDGGATKLWRRLREEPLIPLGLVLTCSALLGAARSMRKGDKHQTNRYFRARIYAQAFTVVVMVAGGIYYKEDREKRKMYLGLLGEKRAREKKQAWIQELEARDREDKADREMARAMREGRRVGRKEIIERLEREEEARMAKFEETKGTARHSVGETAACPLEMRDMRGSILVPAMILWWSRGRDR